MRLCILILRAQQEDLQQSAMGYDKRLKIEAPVVHLLRGRPVFDGTETRHGDWQWLLDLTEPVEARDR